MVVSKQSLSSVINKEELLYILNAKSKVLQSSKKAWTVMGRKLREMAHKTASQPDPNFYYGSVWLGKSLSDEPFLIELPEGSELCV